MLEDALSFPREFADVEEFYWLWILATTTYGVGDTLTTLTLIAVDPRVVEGNPLVATALGAFGVPGLVAWKILAFAVCIATSVYAAQAWRDRFVYYLPPIALAVVGAFFTVLNLRLLLR